MINLEVGKLYKIVIKPGKSYMKDVEDYYNTNVKTNIFLLLEIVSETETRFLAEKYYVVNILNQAGKIITLTLNGIYIDCIDLSINDV